MANYIDGFAHPIARDRVEDYQRVAEAVAAIWEEHGALNYREFVCDDPELEGTRSFTDLMATADNEVVVFGWVEFASREERDLANEKVAEDPRMKMLLGPLVDPAAPVFNAKRMAYGGFKPLL